MKYFIFVNNSVNNVSNWDKIAEVIKSMNVIKSDSEFLLEDLNRPNPIGIKFSLSTCLPTKFVKLSDGVAECDRLILIVNRTSPKSNQIPNELVTDKVTFVALI